MASDHLSNLINFDELAKDKILEIEKCLDTPEIIKPSQLESWFSTLKQIVTAADLHRTNDSKNQKANQDDCTRHTGDSIYADFNDDNEQFNATDLSEQFAINSVKWTIRVLAFKLLHRLVNLPMHVPNSKSKDSNALAFTSLSDLIRLAFVAATSPYDELKMQGFKMFTYLIDNFASIEEKEFLGHSILEQYKTQVLSAIKPAFNLDSPPYITAIASQICSSWICAGIEKDDCELYRAYQLMLQSIKKLDSQSINQNSKLYTECELEQERVEILASWAHLYITSELSETSNNSLKRKLGELVGPRVECLIEKWWEALKDFALLIMPSQKFVGTLHDNEQVYTRDIALRLFDPNWPKFLEACTIWLCKEISQRGIGVLTAHQGSELKLRTYIENNKYCKFISGIVLREFCKALNVSEGLGKKLPESTIVSLKCLQMLLTNPHTQTLYVEEIKLTQEFYNTLFHITITYQRDSNRSMVRSCLHQIFGLLLTKFEDEQHAKGSYVKLFCSLWNELDLALQTTTDSRLAVDCDNHRVRAAIILQNLLILLKRNARYILNEAELQLTLIDTCLKLLNSDQFVPSAINLIDQFKDLCSVLNSEQQSGIIMRFYAPLIKIISETILSLNKIDQGVQKPKIQLLDLLSSSVKSAILNAPTNRSKLMNLYCAALINPLTQDITIPEQQNDLKNDKRKRELTEICINRIDDLRNSYEDFETDLEFELNQRYKSLIQVQRELKSNAATQNLSNVTSNRSKEKSTFKHVPTIKLKVDFSNFCE